MSAHGRGEAITSWLEREPLERIAPRRIASGRATPRPSTTCMELKAALPVGGRGRWSCGPCGALLDSPQIGKVCVLAQEPERACGGPARRSARRAQAIAQRPSRRRSRELISERATRLSAAGDDRRPCLARQAMIAEFIAKAQGRGPRHRGGRTRQHACAASRRRSGPGSGSRAGAYSGANLFAFGRDKVAPAIDAVAHCRAGPQEGLAAACRAGTGAAAWRGAQTADAG